MEEHHIPEDELIATRLDKLEQMRSLGKDPFAIERYERRAVLVVSDGAETKIELNGC